MIEAAQLATYREDARELVAQLYKDEEGKPLTLTDGQCDIFNLIFKKLTPRAHLESTTRYGKSLTVSLAVLTRLCTYPERWAIAAGSDDQARIIMKHLISHIFDNEFTKSRFQIDQGESEESIRRYRNKDRLNFKLEGGLLGEIFVTNAKGAMGFGAPNLIHDEAALTPDDEEALVFRMLGDKTENFYLKIGNPWDSGHFRASAEDPTFFKLRIDYYQAIREGRLAGPFIEEARKRPFFDVLYECKFPPRDTMDDEGWIPLLTKDDIDRALVDPPSVWPGFGVNRLGGDVAGGGKNFSVLVHRQTNIARMLHKSNDPDTMNYAQVILNVVSRERVAPRDVKVDKVGIGKGACDLLSRQESMGGFDGGTNVGDKFEPDTSDHEIYYNLRAKGYWNLRKWVLAGGKLVREGDPDNNWYQLTKIKYRKKLEGMGGKVQIMPKEKMLKDGIQSPDVADGLMLTCIEDEPTHFTTPGSVITPQEVTEPFDRFSPV